MRLQNSHLMLLLSVKEYLFSSEMLPLQVNSPLHQDVLRAEQNICCQARREFQLYQKRNRLRLSAFREYICCSNHIRLPVFPQNQTEGIVKIPVLLRFFSALI